MNTLKTTLLLAAMTTLFGAIGLMLGGRGGMMIALVFAGLMNLGSWWFSSSLVLRLYRAQQIDSGLPFDITRELVMRNRMPMPKVYIIENPQPNAFATGRSPQDSAVAVTTGIMQILDERELRGVIAHELAHIQNRDTLIMTITATLAGAISMLANFALFFGGNRDRQAGILGTLAVMILAPLAASLVQMAVSRTREYIADHSGAQICGDPLALASALHKLGVAAGRINNYDAEQNLATAHMFIVNPLHMRRVDNLFATHPPMEKRIAALQELAKTMQTDFGMGKTSQNPWG